MTFFANKDLAQTLTVALAVAVAIISSGCAQENDSPVNGLAGRLLVVETLQGAVQVDLGDLELVTVEGSSAVRLGDVLRAAGVEPSDDSTVADLVSADGFHPGMKTPCRGLIPIKLALLDQAYVTEFTGETLWKESLDYPGCMHVNGLASLVLFDAAAPGVSVKIGVGETAPLVDLRFLPGTDEGNLEVNLGDIVGSLVSSPSEYRYDIEGNDGKRPGRDGGAQLLTWEDLEEGSVKRESLDASFPKLGEDSVWAVSGLVRIVPTPLENKGRSIEVRFGAGSEKVDLGALASVEFEGQQLARISDAVAAAGVENPESATFTLISSDGFDPTVAKEADLLTWTQLLGGYVSPSTGDASWEPELAMAGYWQVREVSAISVIR